MFKLEEKTAFITGGTSGIGLATAKRFVKAGAKVTICGRRAEGFDLAKNIGARFAQFDITDSEALEDALATCAQYGDGIDFIFNNAGVMDSGPRIKQSDANEFRKILETNLIAVYDLLH